jgi:short-subunit dehydrogenase
MLKLWWNKEEKYKNFFKGKNIVITGASSGIGKCLHEKLVKYDVNLFLIARSFNSKKEGNKNFYKCDGSNYKNVKDVFTNIKTNSDHLDIIIHSAGVGDWKYLTEMSYSEIENSINAPLMSSIYTTKEFLENWNGVKEKKIIFINSPAAIQPWMSSTLYSTSRWGMHGFSEALKMDYYDKNLVVQENILGKINSTYFVNNPECIKRMPSISRIIPELEVEEAANFIIDKIVSSNQRNIFPFMLKFINFLHYYFPSIVKYLIFKLAFLNEAK